MNKFAKVASLITLSLVIVPSLVLFAGTIELSTVKLLALVGTIGWFVATPMWMSCESSINAAETES